MIKGPTARKEDGSYILPDNQETKASRALAESRVVTIFCPAEV